MAIKEYHFEGTVTYAQVQNVNKFGKYSLNFFPKDDQTRKDIKATGIRNSIKEDEGDKSGVSGFYYTFRTEGDAPPVVTDAEGKPVTTLIGNGSEVTIKLSVEDFISPTYGKVVRSKLVGVAVTKLIPYVKAEAAPASEDLPV